MNTDKGIIKSKIIKDCTYELAKGISQYIVFMRTNDSNANGLQSDTPIFESEDIDEATRYFDNLK